MHGLKRWVGQYHAVKGYSSGTLSAMSNPFDLHPNLALDHPRYHGAGMGGVDAERGSIIGMVKVDALHDMPGNAIRDWDEVRALARLLESGKGYNNPVMVGYHHASRTATIEEGNHRVMAARLAGHEYVPTEVVRSSSPLEDDRSRGRVAKRIGPGGRGWPWVQNNNHLYVPSNMHPSWVFHPSEVFNEGW